MGGESSTMWRLRCDKGRQWWDLVDADDGDPQVAAFNREVEIAREKFSANRFEQSHSGDKVLRSLAKYFPFHKEDRLSRKPRENLTSIDEPLRKGISYFSTLQMEDGHWPGDYGGPMFLLPGLVFFCYVSGTDLGEARRSEMRRYLRNHQNKDGGWGLHIEGKSTMKGSILNYLALRLLGTEPDEEAAVQGRGWIQKQGGATYAPSWAKLWLCVLGVFEWEGLDPITPETWLLPYWMPLHPGRYWCHCRMVYLPQAFLYGMRATAKTTELILALRQEVHVEAYETIAWSEVRGRCCPLDQYFQRPKLQKVFWDALYFYEHKVNFPGKQRLRQASLDETMRIIKHEDEHTDWICIGPVNKVLNAMACWFHDPDSDHFKRHIPRLFDYLWLAEDGMKMQGYNGSQLWDTAFAAQAIVATGLAEEFQGVLRDAHAFFDVAQVQEDTPGGMRFYRHISKGAWPFSTRDHGWPISDCSSEGMKGTLAIQSLPFRCYANEVSAERLQDCVNVSLSFQNSTGGWATYEPRRGGEWYEGLNPSEVFSDIMVDLDYVECTSSSVTALVAFQRHFPDHRRAEIDAAIRGGVKTVKAMQRQDGSWYGNWGICFTYGTWFGVEALVAVGETYETSEELRRACTFLVGKQREDGGLGETYKSCEDWEWSEAKSSQVVNTAWALLSLCRAGYPKKEPLSRLAAFLCNSQQENGDWPQQLISGIFNRTCAITYANYRCIFPIWALGCYRQLLLQNKLE